MLTVALGTRTDSTSDPLVQRALRLGKEFMQLTGMFCFTCPTFQNLAYLLQDPGQISSTSSNLCNTSRLLFALEDAGFTTNFWRYMVR